MEVQKLGGDHETLAFLANVHREREQNKKEKGQLKPKFRSTPTNPKITIFVHTRSELETRELKEKRINKGLLFVDNNVQGDI
jgi:hypothetical protein